MTSAFRQELLRVFGQDFGRARRYRPAHALRFELAVGESLSAGLPVARARCMELLLTVFGDQETWLELTFWPQDPADPLRTLEYLSAAGGPSPAVWTLDQFSYEDDGLVTEHRYSAAAPISSDFARILTAIVVEADHGTHGGHFFQLYAFDPRQGLLLHPYDSRGADLYAATADAARPYYERFNAWLLDFDRAAADAWMGRA